MRRLLFLFAFLAASTSAWGTEVVVRPIGHGVQTGTAIGSGYAFPASYFMAPNAPSQLAGAFSYSYWITDSSIPTGSVTYAWVTGGVTTSAGGFDSYSFTAGNRGDGFIQGIAPAYNSSPYTCEKPASGLLCTRNRYINDGARHHVCVSWTPTSGFIMIDGALRQLNPNPGTYTPTNLYWQIGAAGMTLADTAWWGGGRSLSQNECLLIYQRGHAGLSLLSGNAPASLSTGLQLYWPMNNCTSSGCPESIIGTTANLVPTSSGPAVVILTPSAGTVSGSVNFTASCTDMFTCTSVIWTVDGVPLSGPTTSPYTYSWNSATFVDGSHTITATATDTTGATGSASVTVTSSNGTTNHTYYYAASGSDANVPCTNTSLPCATINGSGIVFIGGDTIIFKSAGTFTTTAVSQNIFVGAANTGTIGGVATNVYSGGSSAPITVTSDGSCNVQGSVTAGCAHWQAAGSTQTMFLVAAVSNFIIENQVIVGGTTAALALNGGYGVYLRNYLNAGVPNLPFSGVVVQNNQITDWYNGIGASSVSPVILTSCTIQNNIVEGSNNTESNGDGITIGGPDCSINANVAENINGYGPGGGNYGGNTGIPFGMSSQYQAGTGHLNTATTDEFNVALTSGGNTNFCGNTVGNEMYARYNVTLAFNEVGYQTQAGGCDGYGYDIDLGSSYITMEYNYGHNNYGGGFEVYTGVGSALGNIWTNNILRFNIMENDVKSGSGFANFTLNGATTGTNTFVYNNILYSATPAYCMLFYGNTDMSFYNNICGMGLAFARYTFMNFATPILPVLNNNLYFAYGAAVAHPPVWQCTVGGTTYFSAVFSVWQSSCGEDSHGLNTNPLLVAPGTGGTIYSGGTPAGPQPLPSGYANTGSSPGLGAGVLPPGQTIPRDYYGTACPGAQGGSGYSIGPDGCGNP